MFHLFGPFGNKDKAAAQRLKVLAIVVWLALLVGGLIGHQGSYWVYAIFSVVFTAVLASAVYRQASYGYLFLAVFLWLGFWLKLSVHNIFNYAYVEPIGRFDGTAAAWDEALWVATVAGVAILLGRWMSRAFGGAVSGQVTADSSRVPGWYPSSRRTTWALLLLAAVGLSVLNRVYGIQQSGLASQTILPWPLNGVIYWLLSTGLSMCVATLIWWDICLRKDISLSIYAILGEAFLSTMSLLSRGLFVFHIAPTLLAVYVNKKHVIWKAQRKFILIAMILGALFIVSLSIVSTLRSYLYQPSQDFRSTTQNRITRLQILQTVIPTLEERIVIKSIARIEVLQALIPAVEQLTVLKNMDSAERQLKIRRHKLKSDVPMEEQLQALILERTWLEENLPELKARAAVAKMLYQIDSHASEQEVLIEDQFQALALEKAELEQDLSARKKQANVAMKSWPGKAGLLFNELGYQMTGGLGSRVFALGVDRWIGMEGVMAISSYPEKSNDLFLTALTERSGVGKVTMYQKICQSIYQTADMNKYQFASLPGAAAFFYYTGSLWAVFLGMFFLTLMAIYSEYLVHYLTGNVLLCALVGMNAANAIAQLGVVPRQLLIHFGMLFGAVFIIWLLQSRQLAAIHRKLFCRKIS
ncbi:hypothetical protein, partial [Polaromonas sp.]|jgi:hypothetical protein|uniref:hypothetical protein n=1 Tax=Polaromonas sp. TaxID=1869339 RepID=UPI0037C545B6